MVFITKVLMIKKSLFLLGQKNWWFLNTLYTQQQDPSTVKQTSKKHRFLVSPQAPEGLQFHVRPLFLLWLH